MVVQTTSPTPSTSTAPQTPATRAAAVTETGVAPPRKNPGPNKRRKEAELEILESIANSLNQPFPMCQSDVDEDDVFGNLVAAKLKKIKSQHIKHDVTTKVLNILEEGRRQEGGNYSSRRQDEGNFSMNSNTYNSLDGYNYQMNPFPPGGFLNMMTEQ